MYNIAWRLSRKKSDYQVTGTMYLTLFLVAAYTLPEGMFHRTIWATEFLYVGLWHLWARRDVDLYAGKVRRRLGWLYGVAIALTALLLWHLLERYRLPQYEWNPLSDWCLVAVEWGFLVFIGPALWLYHCFMYWSKAFGERLDRSAAYTGIVCLCVSFPFFDSWWNGTLALAGFVLFATALMTVMGAGPIARSREETEYLRLLEEAGPDPTDHIPGEERLVN